MTFIFDHSKYRFIYLLLIFFSHNLSIAQTSIRGIIKDSLGTPISSVNIYIKPFNKANVVSFSSSDNLGNYTLTVEKTGKFNLFFTQLGYEKIIIPIEIKSENEVEYNVILREKPFELTEIVIKSEKPITIKKDTIIVKVSAFLKGNEQVVEDLLKNIPGLNVESDGTIKVGNQEIEKVMVDGDDFFEKGYKILTKNLPANPIDKIEILKKYSNNKHLKGIENSEKVALNLILKEDAKRVWFGNTALGYGKGNIDRYSVQGSMANFGKKNKYYFLTNINNIGSDATGDIWHLVKPFRFDEPASVGDDQNINSLLSLDLYVPNFKESRTSFNNTELLSLNAIFNPTKKLKIKTLGFFNWDENDFFRNSTESFQASSQPFINTENYVLRKKKVMGFGKLDILYDISKTETLELITKYNNLDEDSQSDLLFNGESTIESLKSNNTLYDQKITLTNKFKKNKVFLLTGRYINEQSPEDYSINQFFYQDLFPSLNSNNVRQSNKNNLEFAGIEGHLLDRKKNGNLLEIQFGNQLRKDKLISSFELKENTNIIGTPEDYQNNVIYTSNDLYLKTKYLLKYKKISFTGKLGIHQFFNQLEEASIKKKETPLFINPKIGFDWKIDDNNKIGTSYANNTTNAKILDVSPNYVLTGFRSFSKGTGNLAQLNASTILFNYQLGNWGKKFFANTFLIYNKKHDFFTTNSIIEQNYSQSNKILIKDKEMLNIATNIDRYFKTISSNLKLNLGYSKSNYKNVVNNSNLREVTSHNYNYGLELRSGYSGVFNYHLGTKWTTNKITTTIDNSFTNNISFLDLSFIFNNNLSVDFQTERYFFGNLDKNNSTYYFADFNARYTLKENKLTFSLVGKNLFNTEKFKEFSISDIGNSTTEYRLLPRYIMLKMEYRF